MFGLDLDLGEGNLLLTSSPSLSHGPTFNLPLECLGLKKPVVRQEGRRILAFLMRQVCRNQNICCIAKTAAYCSS